MSSQKQSIANQKNAQSSTGPKTPAGKAISSQNGVKHGFFAKNDVISGEDPAAYEDHRQDIYEEYAPLTPTESVLTQRIASLSWRLMRADRLQTTTINTLVANQQSAANNTIPQFNIEAMIERLREKDKDPEYPLTDAELILAGIVRHKNKPVTTDPAVDQAMHAANTSTAPNHICPAESQLGRIIYNDFRQSGVLERLLGYEQRIESSLFKTIRQLQQIQERRIKQDAAQEKRDWQYLREEAEERKKQREIEYANRLNPTPDAPQCHPERSRGIRKNTIAAGDSNQNKPNSNLTSISDITYNRYRQEKAKGKESNNPQNRPNHQ